MKIVTWKLEGHPIKRIIGKGAGVQDAFTRLSRKQRSLITLFGVSVIWR